MTVIILLLELSQPWPLGAPPLTYLRQYLSTQEGFGVHVMESRLHKRFTRVTRSEFPSPRPAS